MFLQSFQSQAPSSALSPPWTLHHRRHPQATLLSLLHAKVFSDNRLLGCCTIGGGPAEKPRHIDWSSDPPSRDDSANRLLQPRQVLNGVGRSQWDFNYSASYPGEPLHYLSLTGMGKTLHPNKNFEIKSVCTGTLARNRISSTNPPDPHSLIS